MKPATKKTIIIMAAIAIIAAIVYFVFFRKKEKEWEKILDKLDIDENVKAQIRDVAKGWDSDPEKRKALQKRLGLPERMSTNALLTALNCVITRDELTGMV